MSSRHLFWLQLWHWPWRQSPEGLTGTHGPTQSSRTWLSSGGLSSFLAADQRPLFLSTQASLWGVSSWLAAVLPHSKWSKRKNEKKLTCLLYQNRKLRPVTSVLFCLLEGSHWLQTMSRGRRFRLNLLKGRVSKLLWTYFKTTTVIKAQDKLSLLVIQKTLETNRIPVNPI